jgi:hypothetical protein
MRSKITRLQRRGAFFFCLALGSLILSNCSTQELEFIDPYEFINNDFDGIGDLPAVNDPEMSFSEPETGEVADAEETLAIIADVLRAASGEDITSQTLTSLERVSVFAESLPASVMEKAESLDALAVANLLDPETTLPANLADLQVALADVSSDIAQLLSQIVLSVDFERFRAANAAIKAPSVYVNPTDVLAQSLVGPCADAANSAYAEVTTTLRGQRDAQLATVEANYSRRILEADARYTARLALHAEDLQVNIDEIAATITQLLDAATHSDSIGEPEIAEELRILALFYTIEARTALMTWNDLVLELLENVLAEEKAAIQERRVLVTTEVTANFNAAKVQADAILTNSLNDCHNQGSGN